MAVVDDTPGMTWRYEHHFCELRLVRVGILFGEHIESGRRADGLDFNFESVKMLGGPSGSDVVDNVIEHEVGRAAVRERHHRVRVAVIQTACVTRVRRLRRLVTGHRDTFRAIDVGRHVVQGRDRCGIVVGDRLRKLGLR